MHDERMSWRLRGLKTKGRYRGHLLGSRRRKLDGGVHKRTLCTDSGSLIAERISFSCLFARGVVCSRVSGLLGLAVATRRPLACVFVGLAGEKVASRGLKHMYILAVHLAKLRLHSTYTIQRLAAVSTPRAPRSQRALCSNAVAAQRATTGCCTPARPLCPLPWRHATLNDKSLFSGSQFPTQHDMTAALPHNG